MLIVVILNVITLNVVMLSVNMPNVVMMSVKMPNVLMLSVIVPNVVAPIRPELLLSLSTNSIDKKAFYRLISR